MAGPESRGRKSVFIIIDRWLRTPASKACKWSCPPAGTRQNMVEDGVHVNVGNEDAQI